MSKSMTTAHNEGAKALTFAEKVKGAIRPQVKVPVCLNGDVREQYETVEARVVQRLAEAQQLWEAEAEADADDARLSTPARPPFVPPVDDEQPLLDALAAEMGRWTAMLVIRAMVPQEYDKLLEAHPPRLGADGQRDPRDRRGVNVDTFFPELLRHSVVEPVMDDEMFAEFLTALGTAQLTRLTNAATGVNLKDDDVPLLLGASGSRRTSSGA